MAPDGTIDSEFTTRSGVFTAVSSQISMAQDRFGQYEYRVSGELPPEVLSGVRALDGLRHADEDAIASDLFAGSGPVDHDGVIGYYRGLYCGHVVEGEYRARGSSGGLTTWILTELLALGEIDGVVAVVPTSGGDSLFRYEILRTAEDVRASAKSRYYPVELSGVLEEISRTPGRYAVVGIPSFISDVRRLQRLDPVFRERVAFALALLCGHQKTAKYGEAIAFEAGVEPGSLTSIDFRFKSPQGVARGYVTEVYGREDGQPVRKLVSAADSFVGDWSAGMFKSRFSDLVDDCFGETADVTLGDAWLPQYLGDPGGTNVVVVRNQKIKEMVTAAAASGRLRLDEVDAETVKASQSGLIRHYRTELPYRLAKLGNGRVASRIAPAGQLPLLRRWVQDLRMEISERSLAYYLEATERGDWGHFERRMAPLMWRYKAVYRLIWLRSVGLGGALRRIRKRLVPAASRAGSV